MSINDAELSYNPSWMVLQFQNYDMNLSDIMHLYSSGLQDGNNSHIIPFDTSEISSSDISIKYNENSIRRKGCILFLISITTEQYEILKRTRPDHEEKGAIY